jgi:hypothetical protein
MTDITRVITIATRETTVRAEIVGKIRAIFGFSTKLISMNCLPIEKKNK